MCGGQPGDEEKDIHGGRETKEAAKGGGGWLISLYYEFRILCQSPEASWRVNQWGAVVWPPAQIVI